MVTKKRRLTLAELEVQLALTREELNKANTTIRHQKAEIGSLTDHIEERYKSGLLAAEVVTDLKVQNKGLIERNDQLLADIVNRGRIRAKYDIHYKAVRELLMRGNELDKDRFEFLCNENCPRNDQFFIHKLAQIFEELGCKISDRDIEEMVRNNVRTAVFQANLGSVMKDGKMVSTIEIKDVETGQVLSKYEHGNPSKQEMEGMLSVNARITGAEVWHDPGEETTKPKKRR